MPLIQITLPDDVFSAEQEQQLAESSVEALLELEGMAQNPKAKMLSWVYLNKHPATDYLLADKVRKSRIIDLMCRCLLALCRRIRRPL